MKGFAKRVKENRKITMKFIRKKIQQGKTIYLYGASTKGNTVLQYYGLNHKRIPFGAERSPEKWGKYTIGTGININSEKTIEFIKNKTIIKNGFTYNRNTNKRIFIGYYLGYIRLIDNI